MEAERPLCRLGKTCRTPEDVAAATRELANILWPMTAADLGMRLRPESAAGQ